MSFTLTLRKALEIQTKQLDHYCNNVPYGDKIRAEIGSRTNVEGMDLDEELPAHIVNRHVPRGGIIEALWYREQDAARAEREPGMIKTAIINQLQTVRLTTTSGHSWKTNMAAAVTEADAIAYFLGKRFDVSNDPDVERLERVIKVEYNPAE